MNYIPNSMAAMIATAGLAAPSLLANDPELQAKADQAHAATMALAEALTRSTHVPGNDTLH
ncbi:hypothetical protein [Pseudomonas putida]|uniref:hypothetical protein n=1 Tax=Pseudomonas putida TaxID=303 RepID=UPI003850B746